jgi:t-SNARE complex subunit (syntaxin)
MAARSPSERHTAVTLDIENPSPETHADKQNGDKDKHTSLKSSAATRVEKICKLLAVLLVVIAFVVHLVRVLSNGKYRVLLALIHLIYI